MYRLLLIPSSDEERFVEQADSLEKALKLARKRNVHHVDLTFNTPEEREACVKGYLAGIGYLGGGLYFTG